jgi:hypothetical protein
LLITVKLHIICHLKWKKSTVINTNLEKEKEKKIF